MSKPLTRCVQSRPTAVWGPFALPRHLWSAGRYWIFRTGRDIEARRHGLLLMEGIKFEIYLLLFRTHFSKNVFFSLFSSSKSKMAAYRSSSQRRLDNIRWSWRLRRACTKRRTLVPRPYWRIERANTGPWPTRTSRLRIAAEKLTNFDGSL